MSSPEALPHDRAGTKVGARVIELIRNAPRTSSPNLYRLLYSSSWLSLVLAEGGKNNAGIKILGYNRHSFDPLSFPHIFVPG